MKKNKVVFYWSDCSLPASLFFEILESDDKTKLIQKDIYSKYQKLPKKQELENAWDDIFDEFFKLKNDPKMRLILKVKKSILVLYAKINTIDTVVRAVSSMIMTEEMRDGLLTKLKPLGVHFEKGLNSREKILKILNYHLAGFRNRIALEEDNLKQLTKGVRQTFEEKCVALEEFGYSISEDVSLRRYLAYEKGAKKQNSNGRSTNRKHKPTGSR